MHMNTKAATLRCAIGLAIALLFCTGAGLRAELIDRILAVVEGQPITLSDARAAPTFSLVDVPRSGDPIGAALDRLIERELILIEVRRYQPAEPAMSSVQARLDEVRKRFPPDMKAYQRALQLTGMTEPRLEAFVRDTLRAETYMNDRFATAAPPTDDELVRYYREHETEFIVNGVLPPFETVRSRVLERLLAERRQRLMANWIAGLRRRSDIQILYGILPSR